MMVRDLCNLIIDDVRIYAYSVELVDYVKLYEGRYRSIPKNLLDREVALIFNSGRFNSLGIKIF